MTLCCILLGSWAGADESGGDWPVHGGDPGGQHYSPRIQIDRRNVSDLRVAWTFHTGALRIPGTTNARSSFEANPVLWDGRLYVDTPYDAVFALDAGTGVPVWIYDPQVSHDTHFGVVTSRGVALWHGPTQGPSGCARDRVFVATLDRRLIARSARDGTPCADFGNGGTVDLAAGLQLVDTQWYSFTSPPTVVGNVVAIGSSVGDNQLVEAPSGVIRGFDAKSGRLLWSYEGKYMTLMLMLKAPCILKAGTATAPVTDWSLYDHHHRERYLDRPQDNAAGFEVSTMLTYSNNLQGPLLVLQGTADDNICSL